MLLQCMHYTPTTRSLWTSHACRIGLKPYVDVSVRAPSLTTVCIPEGVDGMKVIQIMRERFQIEIGGALGSLKGKCWRIGLMGYNNRPEIVKMCISALEEAIELSKK